MKKSLILITAFLLAFQFSKAQTEKGDQTLGTYLGFQYTKNSDYTIFVGDNSTSNNNSKTTAFSIGPNYSYFIKDNLDIGGVFSYTYSGTTNSTENLATTNDNYPVKQTTNNYSLSLFVRKYFMYKNKIGIRTGAYAGYSDGTTKNTYSVSNALYNYDGTNNYYDAGTNLDLVYYPSKSLGISATLANLEYVHYKSSSTTQGHDSSDTIEFNVFNTGLSLSVFYVFGGK
jgi:hypothetical protein